MVGWKQLLRCKGEKLQFKMSSLHICSVFLDGLGFVKGCCILSYCSYSKSFSSHHLPFFLIYHENAVASEHQLLSTQLTQFMQLTQLTKQITTEANQNS